MIWRFQLVGIAMHAVCMQTSADIFEVCDTNGAETDHLAARFLPTNPAFFGGQQALSR